MSVSQYLFLAVTQLGQMSCLPARDENLFLAVRQHRQQDLSEHVKASFSQSEEVFSNSHITTYAEEEPLLLTYKTSCKIHT